MYDYLNAPFTNAGSAPQISWVDPSVAADDAAVALMFFEDENLAMGNIPRGQTVAVANGHSKGVSKTKERMAQAGSTMKKTANRSDANSRQVYDSCAARLRKLQTALDTSRQRRATTQHAPDYPGAQYHGPEHAASPVGGLEFIVNSPPGVGRIERLPFNVIAVGGGSAGTIVGDSIVQVAAGTAAGLVTMATDQIPWAVVRLVGVEITRTINNPGGGAPDFYNLTTFNVGGGADLFLQQGGIDLDYFAAGLDRIPGLRDYPIVRSPNQAFITVSWQNAIGGAVTTAQDTIIGVDLLVDVLADDQFGAHNPGPYARGTSRKGCKGSC